jgi:hypothetical protein
MVKHKYRDKVDEPPTIMDYIKQASHITVTNATLQDRNTFYSRLQQKDPVLPRRAPDDNVGYTLSLH